MATKKYQITQLQNDDSLLVLHPETDADIVSVTNGSGAYGGQATNVQDALEEVYSLAQTGGVTGVKGDAESSYRTGDVNITKANIGLGNVTNDAQVKGLASGTTENHIVTFGADGYSVKDSGVVISTTTPNFLLSTDAQVPTAKAVATLFSSVASPMKFKGTLGYSTSTYETLPTPPDYSMNGWVLKVVKDGLYNTQGSGSAYNINAKVGDMFICAKDPSLNDAYNWMYIPSGDDIEDTWRNIKVNGTEYKGNGITTGAVNFMDGGNITVRAYAQGILLGVESGYSIPSTTDQSSWTAKYDKPSGGIPKTDLASAVQTSLGKADTSLQSHQTITLSGDATGTSNNGALAVTLANTGVTAGTYSTVTVDAKGRATAGGQIIEVGAANQTTPSSSLAVGGIFFKQV